MRVIAPCPQCGREVYDTLMTGAGNNALLAQQPQLPTVELNCWPYYEHTCPKGHKTRMTLQNELYELLFQQAVYCIQDGYYREAVGTFHAALERFMEFATEVLSYKAIENLDFDAIWKRIGNQSERQLGAFLITYQLILGKTPQKFDDKAVKLRNDVVHKGKLVTRDEAIGHGQYVMDYIRATMAEIKNLHSEDELALSCMRRLARICKADFERSYKHPIEIETPDGVMYQGISQAAIPSFLSSTIISEHPEYRMVEQCLEARGQLGFIK